MPRASMRSTEAPKHPAATKSNPEAGDTGTIPSIVQSNALARKPHQLLLTTFPGVKRHNRHPSQLTNRAVGSV